MINSWLSELVRATRLLGAEADRVEVKAAQGGLPDSAKESLCAFANTPGGGYLVLGLTDPPDLSPVGVADPNALQAELASVCRDAFEPPLQPEIVTGTIDGAAVVAAFVPELPREQKPCFVRTRGITRGSYLRLGGTDRRLTSEEVQQLIADRGQPSFDTQLVPGATLEDLDRHAISEYLHRLRTANPRLLRGEPDQVVLRMTQVVAPDEETGIDRPTLAGLLAVGRYPQQFLPQLNITFVHYPTTTGESMPDGVRFLDNVSINGAVPYLVSEVLTVIQRNMTRRSLISGAGRTDVWEYPLEAVREAVVNALVHRDLSPGSRGTQVQVEMYPDRLRIHNPGGLFGALDINRLAEEGRSSARNAALMKILEDVVVPGEARTVCENRGSGIRAMLTALRRAGMSPPTFRDRVTSFDVVMPNHALLDDDTVRWLNHVAGELRDSQCLGLALLRRGEVLDSARYRAATGIADSRTATTELQDLVARELVTQVGTRGSTRYLLAPGVRNGTSAGVAQRPDRRTELMNTLSAHGALTKTELAELLGVSPKTIEHWVRVLKREGIISVDGGRGRHTTYRVAGGS